MSDEDREQIERDLHKLTQFPQPFERLHQESLMFESAYVTSVGRARFVIYSIPFRMTLMLGAVFVVGRADGWLQVVAGIVLTTFATLGVGAPLRRMQAYRNGWLDRGRHDITEHQLACGDPVTQEAFSHRMMQLNMESLL